jgi:hypothetical protein
MNLTPMKASPTREVKEAVDLAKIIQRKLFHGHNKRIGIEKGSAEERFHLVMKDWIARLENGELNVCLATSLGTVSANKHLSPVLTQADGGGRAADAMLIDAELGPDKPGAGLSAFVMHAIQESQKPAILRPAGGLLVMISILDRAADSSLEPLLAGALDQGIPVILANDVTSEVRLSNLYPAFEVKAHSPAVVALVLLCVGHAVSELLRLAADKDPQVAEDCMKAVKFAFFLNEDTPTL